MNSALKAFINEITVDSKCALNEVLTEFYKAAGMHFSFNAISEEEKVAMRKIAEEMNMNETFVNHFLEHFTEHVTPLGLFEVVKHIDTIADSVDVRIGLEKIFKHPCSTEHMKDYVKVWLMQPLQVMEKLQEFLTQMMFDDEQILNVALKDKTLFTKAVKKALIHPEDFNLTSFIVYNENDVPARVHSYTEEVLALDVSGIVSVDDIRERIVSIKIDDFKGPETGLDGLRNATECLLKIHQAYPTMQANMINYSTRSINSSMMGGVKLSAARVVRLYAGDYADYANESAPEEEQQLTETTPEPTAENSAVRGLITNPEGFNALSASARRLVAQHLPATRKQFNQIIVNAINSVHTWMPQLINAKTSNRELNRVIDGLAKSYKSISGQQGMVDWFMHKFAPAVNAYRARGFAPTGIAVVDNVFGGSPMKNATRIYGSGMSGGVRTVYINRNEDTGSHRIFGGGVIGDYFEGVKRAQIKFNDQFDDLYRKLTAAVRNVADKQQFTSEQGIARVIEALMSITIGSKKTVMKISGLRPKEDLNTRYTSMVEHVIKTIENTKIGGFGEVISVLRSLVSLLKSVRAEAQQLIKRVSEGTKSSEEIVKYITFERDEIPSKLTPQELHALVESINALVYANHGHQLTSKIERHREENVKEYIKKVTDRTEAINDYYENSKDRWLKYTRTVDADTRTFIKTHLKSIQSAMVYFNEKVDTKLMQWRQKMAKGGNITKKQIEDIERLTMTYMHYRPGEKILQIFAKLEKLRSEVKDELSIGDIYKVTDVMHKIVMNAGYVEMIQDLYKVLEIDTDGFDWNLFKINLTKLLVDKIVCVDESAFKFYIDAETAFGDGGAFIKGKDQTGFSTAGLYRFVKIIYGKIKGHHELKDWGYNMLFNLVIAAFTSNGDNNSNIIASGLNIPSRTPLAGNYAMLTKTALQGGAFNLPEARFTGENRILPVSDYNLHKETYTKDEHARIKAMFKAINIPVPATDADIGNVLWHFDDQLDEADADHQIIRVKYAMLDHLTTVLRKNKVYGTYDMDKLKKFVEVMYAAFMYKPADVAGLRNSFIMLENDTPHIGITWDGYFSQSRETTIIVDVFHSMIANVLYTFNRYIALRYTGTDTQLPIPMMSSAMLGGDLDGVGSSMEGTKMDAGSAIDVIGVHDLKFDKVIPEAVPFYAIALDIFGTFMTTIYEHYSAGEDRPKDESKDALGDKAFGMYVTISEFSLLHQLYEILKEYTSIGTVRGNAGRKLETSEYLAPLTEVQIKMIIAELNKVWNLVSGTGKEKLMNAIDYVIGEINASILFTSKNRYEQLKRDGHVDLDISTKVEQQFNGLIDELQKVITANLDIVTTMNPDAMREFESFLTITVDKVSKETNETARLNYVRDIINDGKKSVYKTPFEEYYKFCEFVITPIMIAAVSYKRLFDLLDSVKTSVKGESLFMDLKKYNVAVAKEGADMIFGAAQPVRDLMDADSMVNVADICIAAHRAEGLTGKMLGAAATLINSPVVAEYNTILIKQALQTALVNNQPFVMPEIWLPLIPSTYPTEHKFVLNTNFHTLAQKGRIGSILQANVALHELYPNIKSDNIIDFANAMLRDFSADFDHLLHTFMTFPGISDRFLMQLKSVHENATTSLKKLMQAGLWEGDDFLLDSLKDKKLSTLSIAAAPGYPSDLNIQAYTGTVNIPALSTQQSGTVTGDSYTMVGTGQVIHSLAITTTNKTSVTAGKQQCQYGPLDWIIYKLASCNTTGYTLPVMLYELLKSNSLIGKHLVECAIDGAKVIYVPHSSGYVYNIVTQNILTRSATDRNRQDSGELKNMNKTWLANLVSVIPGLISYVSALAKSTDKSVTDYNGINIEQLGITITTILESFYEECVPIMPFIPFMSDYVPGTYYTAIERKLSKYHSIAEIYQSIADPECDLDGLKFEWANRPYYINGLQIPFPEYKNKDKFEGLKKWGGSIFQNSLFADEFNGTMDILARATVRCRIIKRNASTVLSGEPVVNGDVNYSVDPVSLCIKTIKKCYEMDPVVIEILINNIIRRLRATATGMLGGYVSFNGPANNTEPQIVKVDDNPAIPRIKALLNGIFTITGNIEGRIFQNKESIELDINSAISLLYDNPNIRPFYGFESSANEAKEIYNSAGNLVFLRYDDMDVKGALKLAAEENVSVDASTRGKELLAFSVVNQKPIVALTDNTYTSAYKGTIATSAMYANKNANPRLTLGQYREILRDSTHDPTTIANALNNDGRAYNARVKTDNKTQKVFRDLIEGYANMSRLMIASNALYALGINVVRLLSAHDIVQLGTTAAGVYNRTVLYEIINYLSLNKNGQMVLLVGAAQGPFPSITTRPIGDPGTANNYTANVLNVNDQVIDGLTRWDGIGDADNMILRLNTMSSFNTNDGGGDPGTGASFTAANRLKIGRVLRAIIYAINSDAFERVEDVVGAIIVNSAIDIDDEQQTDDAEEAFKPLSTETADIFGKTITKDNNRTTAKMTRTIMTVKKPNATAGDFVIADQLVPKLNRLFILYALLTRRSGIIADTLIAEMTQNPILNDDARILSFDDSILTRFITMLGFDTAEKIIELCKSENATDRVNAVCKLLGTIIEIKIRAWFHESNNAINFVQILGPKIMEYITTINPPIKKWDDKVELAENMRISNAVKSGSLAFMLFRLFYNGDETGEFIKALTKKMGGNDTLFTTSNSTINGSLWSSVLSFALYGKSYINGAASQRDRFVTKRQPQCWAGANNISFIPLTKDGDEFKPFVFDTNKVTVFGDEYNKITPTEAGFGFGKPAVVLNMITNSGCIYRFRADVGDNFISQLYNPGTVSSVLNVRNINYGSITQITNLLRMLGYLSIARSPLYSTIINVDNPNKLEKNLLLASFTWSEFDTDSGFDLDDAAITKLPLLSTEMSAESQKAIYNIHADLACSLAMKSKNISLTEILKDPVYIKGLTTYNGRYELSRAAAFANEIAESRYMYRYDPATLRNALRYNDAPNAAGMIDIGTSTHTENNIRLTELPIIVPSIRPINKLTTTSVKMYQLLPRAISEYMLWNPGYEYANLVADVAITERIHIPFDVIIEPAYSYPINTNIANAFDYGKDANLVINNAKFLHYSLSVGLFDDELSKVGGMQNNWYQKFQNNIREGGARNIAFKSYICSTNNDALKPKVNPVPGDIVQNYDPSALITRLTSILEKWCNDFINHANNIPQRDGWSLNMLGGDINFMAYIDKDKVSSGEPYKIYPAIYPTIETGGDTAPGLSFYTKLFRSISHTTNSIGSLALVYFNRSLLTFSGILSNFVYPNAIYGKSIFNRFANGLSKAIGDISQKVYNSAKKAYSETEATKRRWDFYTLYAENFSQTINGEIINASDRAFYALNQCMFDDAHKERTKGVREFDKMTIAKLAETFTHNFGAGAATENVQSKLSSEFTAPSICNSFLTILHNLLIGKTNAKGDPETEDKLAKMEWFIGTDTMGTLRSIDALLTYTSVIASLIKQLSFYDMDEDEERTYIPRDPAEPFMGVEPENRF